MTDVDLAATARLIGDPARAAMLDALVGGVPLAAGELARTDPTSADDFMEILREHLATWPDGSTAPEARLRLGYSAEVRGQWQEALDAYAGIPGTSPHFSAALDRLSTLAKEHPDSGPIQVAHAALLLQSEDRKLIETARDQWQLIARRSPPGSQRRLRAEYSVALSHFKLGDKEAAAAVLRAALAAPTSLQRTEWEERFKSLLQQSSH